jgi:hypothetical protein
MNEFKLSKCIFVVIVVLMTTISCNKILNQEPKNSTYLQQYWKTASDCKSALAGDYSLLRAALSYKNDSYYIYGDGVPGNYFTIQYNGDGLEGIQSGDFTTTYNVNSLGNWSRFYKVVAMSNLIIKKVPLMSDASLESDVDDVT